MHRRRLITGLISLVAAPAIVRASSLMAVRAIERAPFEFSGFYSVFPFDPAAAEYLEGMSIKVAETLFYGAR